MDPATQSILDIWQTADTVNQIWERLGYLNGNLMLTNALLGILIWVLRGRVQRDQPDSDSQSTPQPQDKKECEP